jgi:hypothetical protein
MLEYARAARPARGRSCASDVSDEIRAAAA